MQSRSFSSVQIKRVICCLISSRHYSKQVLSACVVTQTSTANCKYAVTNTVRIPFTFFYCINLKISSCKLKCFFLYQSTFFQRVEGTALLFISSQNVRVSTRVFITFTLKTMENSDKMDETQNLSVLFSTSVVAQN